MLVDGIEFLDYNMQIGWGKYDGTVVAVIT